MLRDYTGVFNQNIHPCPLIRRITGNITAHAWNQGGTLYMELKIRAYRTAVLKMSPAARPVPMFLCWHQMLLPERPAATCRSPVSPLMGGDFPASSYLVTSGYDHIRGRHQGTPVLNDTCDYSVDLYRFILLSIFASSRSRGKTTSGNANVTLTFVSSCPLQLSCI